MAGGDADSHRCRRPSPRPTRRTRRDPERDLDPLDLEVDPPTADARDAGAAGLSHPDAPSESAASPTGPFPTVMTVPASTEGGQARRGWFSSERGRGAGVRPTTGTAGGTATGACHAYRARQSQPPQDGTLAAIAQWCRNFSTPYLVEYESPCGPGQTLKAARVDPVDVGLPGRDGQGDEARGAQQCEMVEQGRPRPVEGGGGPTRVRGPARSAWSRGPGSRHRPRCPAPAAAGGVGHAADAQRGMDDTVRSGWSTEMRIGSTSAEPTRRHGREPPAHNGSRA